MPARGIDLPFIRKESQDDRRTRHRHAAAEDKSGNPWHSKSVERTRDQGHSHADLEATANESGPPERAHPFNREFEPDLEEQEHDADLGEFADGFGVAHEAGCAGTRQGTDDEEADDGWESKAVSGCDGRCR